MLILLSMILQIVTYVLLALGSIYEQEWMTFGSLVTLMISLYLCKLELE